MGSSLGFRWDRRIRAKAGTWEPSASEPEPLSAAQLLPPGQLSALAAESERIATPPNHRGRATLRNPSL